MPRTYAYSANFDSETEKLLREAKFLGEGHNGIVFELPDNKALKIFTEEKCCREEGETLKSVNKSKYFPKIYKMGSNYILREKVYGERLDEYIRKNGLNFEVSKSIHDLLNEFRKLNFTKIDIRCRDIYVNKNKVMIIDPKHYYRRKVNYPRHLLKGLHKLGVLKDFIYYIKKIDLKEGLEWESKFKNYLTENEKLI